MKANSYKEIMVDGISYTVSYLPGDADLGTIELIVLRDFVNNRVGDVVLNHNLEQAEATISDRGPESINYFEFNDKTPEEIGTWMASVAE